MTAAEPVPLVSVVIPVRDGAAFLAAAIESVRAQRAAETEIVVVDDGSADGSAAIARSFDRVRVVATPPRGQSAARNTGAEAATGAFLAFLDADDLWAADKLAVQLGAFATRETLDVAFAHALAFRDLDRDGRPVPIGGAIAAQLPGAMLLRRETFRRVGPYDEGLTVGEPLDWYARATDLGLVVETLPDILLFRRLHADNLGRRVETPGTAYTRVLRTILERRRSGHGEG